MAPRTSINAERISKIKERRKVQPSFEALYKEIIKGSSTALSRGITLIESAQKEDVDKASALIKACLGLGDKTIRIGITGVPGVGKSTFIEILGKHLTALGKKVAVLAIDPTSTKTKGSILGDKTRMSELVKDSNVFIRPSPSGSSLGGVTRKTRETIMLCEAASYDVILVETVGVGQSETIVHSMVDFFLLLKLPGAGDGLQGIKRGIIEMADAIVINKADGDAIKAARIAENDFRQALHLYPPKEDNWVPQVLSCSALKNQGIDKIWNLVATHNRQSRRSGAFEAKRQEQNKFWLVQTLEDELKKQFFENATLKTHLDKMITAVMKNEISPFSAVERLLELQKSKPN